MPKILTNTILFLVSSTICLLCLEASLRLFSDVVPEIPASEQPWFRNNDKAVREFQVDAELGFIPLMGGKSYTEFGTLRNDNPVEKRGDVRRVLFLGDSVTKRQKITKPLEALYGNESYRFWNAGVTSFNTTQELNFYRRYNAALKPDEVILFFHLNDFETTPVAFRDDAGRFVVYSPHTPLTRINRPLLIYSYLYRMYVNASLSRKKERPDFSDEVKTSLSQLRDMLSAGNVSFKVVLLPILNPTEQWTTREKTSRANIIRILGELNIASFDLLEIMNKALEEKVMVQESPGDHWHPSAEMGKRFAMYLFEQGLLEQKSYTNRK